VGCLAYLDLFVLLRLVASAASNAAYYGSARKRPLKFFRGVGDHARKLINLKKK
jgi:hypothetical protein